MIKIGFISCCLVAWIALGANYYSLHCCEETAPSKQLMEGRLPFQNQPFSLLYPALSINVESEGSVLFKRGQSEPIIPERITESFIDIVKTLKVNPLFQLQIHTGLHDTEDASIGTQRYDALKAIFESTGLPAYQINRGSDLAFSDIENDLISGLCSVSIAHIYPITFADSINDENISIADNISFALNGLEFLTKFNLRTRDQFQQMADYLKQHSDRQIIITGTYLASEKNTSAFPDMGLARANKIRLLISSLGAKGGQIDIQSTIDSSDQALCYSSFVDTFLKVPFSLISAAYPRTSYQKQWRDQKRYEEKFTNDQIYRFLQFGADEMRADPSANQRENLQAINTYMVRNPKAKIFLVGHSNNYYDREKNYSLGYDRSRFIKNFLIQNGFDAKRIVVRSMGARYPLGSDKTLFGQNHNRRVDLFISFDGKESWYYDSRYDQNYQKNLKENKR